MRRYVRYLLVSLTAVCIGITSACTTSAAQPESPTEGSGIQPTRVVVRILNLNLAPLNAPTINQVQAPTPTPTLLQAPSPQPSNTSIQATAAPIAQSSPTQGCTNKAEFIQHTTLNDYTELKPNLNYTKVWRIKNAGTCTWTTDYAIVYSGGDQLGAPDQVPFPNEVKPGETIDLTIPIVGPVEFKAYTGSWMLRDQAGNLFGIGEEANEPLVFIVQVIRHYKLTPP